MTAQERAVKVLRNLVTSSTTSWFSKEVPYTKGLELITQAIEDAVAEETAWLHTHCDNESKLHQSQIKEAMELVDASVADERTYARRMIDTAVKQERETCAKVVDGYANNNWPAGVSFVQDAKRHAAINTAEAIRSRK